MTSPTRPDIERIIIDGEYTNKDIAGMAKYIRYLEKETQRIAIDFVTLSEEFEDTKHKITAMEERIAKANAYIKAESPIVIELMEFLHVESYDITRKVKKVLAERNAFMKMHQEILALYSIPCSCNTDEICEGASLLAGMSEKVLRDFYPNDYPYDTSEEAAPIPKLQPGIDLTRHSSLGSDSKADQ